MLDLVVPARCGGCGAEATRWCTRCARDLTPTADRPWLVSPRFDPGVPVFSLGRYAGPRRAAIIALKEHGRADLAAPLGAALAGGVARLRAWGVLSGPVTVVPAPTRLLAARRRGGDPVAALAARASRLPLVEHAAALRMRVGTRDSVGLDPAGRARNISGAVRLRRPGAAGPHAVLLVDDVVTTGATAAESVRVLTDGGAAVAAVLVLAHA